MQSHGRKVLFDIMFWLISEIVLNLCGFDDTAAYSEFMLVRESVIFTSYPHDIVVTIPSSCPWLIGLQSA